MIREDKKTEVFFFFSPVDVPSFKTTRIYDRCDTVWDYSGLVYTGW